MDFHHSNLLTILWIIIFTVPIPFFEIILSTNFSKALIFFTKVTVFYCLPILFFSVAILPSCSAIKVFVLAGSSSFAISSGLVACSTAHSSFHKKFLLYYNLDSIVNTFLSLTTLCYNPILLIISFFAIFILRSNWAIFFKLFFFLALIKSFSNSIIRLFLVPIF